MPPVSENVWERIKTDFESQVQTEIAEILNLYSGSERERVQLCILGLAEGKADDVYSLVDAANRDYRDIIYWAEYAEESQVNTPEKRQKMRDLFQWLGAEIPDELKEREK